MYLVADCGGRYLFGRGVGVTLFPHAGSDGQTCAVQHGALSDINVARKQTLSPGFAFLIVAMIVVDWPVCKGVERLKSCGLSVNVVPESGVRRICDMSLPVLLVTVNV